MLIYITNGEKEIKMAPILSMKLTIIWQSIANVIYNLTFIQLFDY